jgi:biofilm PGA synthesis N-glycosyltransferase PgaC
VTIFIAVIVVYLIFLAIIGIGLRRLDFHRPNQSDVVHKISVIVPVRNEADNIAILLESIFDQKYKSFEVILVDDHSTDNTVKIASGFQTLRILRNEKAGKKHAITTGIKHSTGTVIVTTDGDCKVQPEWLSQINTCLLNEKVCLLVGPVKINAHQSTFARMQAIEFASLIGSAAATLALGKPTMCNGANLAFRKRAFSEVDGYAGNFDTPSGDDEFLMRKISAKYPGSIAFLASPDGIVSTRPQASLETFIQQRIRWASKFRKNNDVTTVFTAVFVWLIQLGLLGSVIYFIVRPTPLFVLLLILKIVCEAALLRSFCRFLRVEWDWIAFAGLQCVYPFYVVTTGLVSLFSGFQWKGRRFR